MKARSELLIGALAPVRAKKAGPVPRLPADQRKALILARASDFFSEYGLTAQTRPLAAACGVTQRLLYRYFPSKAALLAEVYGESIVAPFKAVWMVQFKDRSQPLEDRLFQFYRNYYREVLTRKWLRLFLYASLAEVTMAPDFTRAILMDMLETVVAEVAHEKGIRVPCQRKTTHEIGWILHGAVSHLAIRRHLYKLSQDIDEDMVLALYVRSFIGGFSAAVDAARTTRTSRPRARRTARA